MEPRRLVEQLSDPAFYPEPTQSVEVIQTHISTIYLTDHLAYKVKKPVDFGFLDYTTLEKRRTMCEREVTLNRRLCPDTYLGVVEIREHDGTLAIGGPGEVVEVAVKMKRLPQRRMLREVLRRGQGHSAFFQQIARILADFHAHAETGPQISAMKDLDGVKLNCDENFAQTEKYVGTLISVRTFEFVRTATELFFKRHAELFHHRAATSRVRDGHGDVHLDSICVTDPIRIFDCIEFNERFRIQDVAEEVAFLAMDLEFHGYTPFARAFVDAYVEASGDRHLFKLLDFYKAYRAYVRAKVHSFQADDPGIAAEQREQVRSIATRYYELAARYAASFNPQRLYVSCGVMGSGKSTLARTLGERYALKVIRSDVVRKELLGLPPDARRHVGWDQAEYSPAVTERTYGEMLERAEKLIEVGQSVVLDGCYAKGAQRHAVVKLARRLKVPMLLLECRASEEVIRERLERRSAKNGSVSDGRWEIYHQQVKEFEAPEEIPGDSRVVLDRSKPIEELMDELGAVVPAEWHDS
ncbi:MAG TPA: AAA family ATPase [Thermoanaerobaculaceae bacterium]|nr:AAA family ATPase [Thermoanaerobaculaceae bacterium]